MVTQRTRMSTTSPPAEAQGEKCANRSSEPTPKRQTTLLRSKACHGPLGVPQHADRAPLPYKGLRWGTPPPPLLHGCQGGRAQTAAAGQRRIAKPCYCVSGCEIGRTVSLYTQVARSSRRRISVVVFFPLLPQRSMGRKRHALHQANAASPGHAIARRGVS